MSYFRPTVVILVFSTLVFGLAYPFMISLGLEFTFGHQSAGSIIYVNNKPVGSELIGQEFKQPEYFWGRPSATQPYAYNTLNSGSSNLSISNPLLLDAIKNRINALRASNTTKMKIPLELVTASGSGLDPHISIEGAYYQIPRIAKYRQIKEENLKHIVDQFSDKRTFGFMGENTVNVLKLNIHLDKLQQENDRQ